MQYHYHQLPTNSAKSTASVKLKTCVKNSYFGVEKFNFSLALCLSLTCVVRSCQAQNKKKSGLKTALISNITINKFIKNHSTEKSKPKGAVLKY